MSVPSDKAVEAAFNAYDKLPRSPSECRTAHGPRDAVIAAHDPALGLDASVCLRDVVDALRRLPGSTGLITEWFEREHAAGRL